MDLLHRSCVGMDVHKDSVVASVRRIDGSGVLHEEVRTFGTMTSDLLTLMDWLGSMGVTIGAMEATGVYWKPLWNLLEGQLELILVNPRDVKQVPGRKTDVKDCQWIAQLLSVGLLKASFVPPRPQRELRDLTRTRMSLLQDAARVANRLQKVLEDANIKLASVASDVLGISGRLMLQALIEGRQTPDQMAEMAKRRLREKIPQLRKALQGQMNDHHRYMLGLYLDQLQHLEGLIEQMDERIEAVMSPLMKAAVERLDEIPGIDPRAAQNILAEIGLDMTRFATSGHMASWAGICPGNNQSAGKRRSGRMMRGNRWLKATLNQCAWAATRKKHSYFRAQHRRIASRRGVKRATMAVGHTLLNTCWQLLRYELLYQDLGEDYFARLDANRTRTRLIRQLERLGYQVSVEKRPAA